MNNQDAKRVLETALICASQPLQLREMRALFEDQVGTDTLRALLDELVADWRGRGVELVCLASGWRLQSRPEMREYLDRLNPEKPARYSRAVMETLTIIAYRQPVTRGDIEDIRGVAVGSQIVKQLEERGWIEAIGYREAPGRPALYATTRHFLDDLGLASLQDLPALEGGGGPTHSSAGGMPVQASLLDAALQGSEGSSSGDDAQGVEMAGHSDADVQPAVVADLAADADGRSTDEVAFPQPGPAAADSEPHGTRVDTAVSSELQPSS
jgi:segregation and condensation protein B